MRNRKHFFYPTGHWLLTVLCVSGIITLVMGCNNNSDADSIPTDIPFRADGILDIKDTTGVQVTRLAIEIAEGDSARARGLMDRRSLPARGGMLFLSDDEKEQTFWMKNTPLPLDIMFITADSQIVSIVPRTRPLSQDIISSGQPAQYVLEVRAGFTDRYGIEVGHRVSWKRVASNS